jgi:heme-degrading monooxygenase HmoA
MPLDEGVRITYARSMSDTDKHYSALQPGRDIVTLVNVFTVSPGGQARFAEAQIGEYRRLRGQVAGSLSANLHRGFDGLTLANLAQFRSMAEYRAWVESELMREHGLVIRHMIERSEPGMYRVAHVATGAGGNVVFVKTSENGGPLVQIVRLRVADEARAHLLSKLASASSTLVREVPGLVSMTVLDGQPIGLAPPPSHGAPRGVVGDEKVAFQSPLVTLYIQLDDSAAYERIVTHQLFRPNLTASAGVLEMHSHQFEVAFVLNDDLEKPTQ